MKENEMTNMEIRSEGVDSILGKTPNKLIIYGTSLILGFIVLLLLGTMIFPYPEKIDCKFVITSSNPPIQLFSQSAGQIRLYVNDKQQVSEGQVLALINNPAVITDVLFAEQLLDSLGTKKVFTPLKVSNLKLGEMTQTFLDLEKSIDDYCSYINLNQIPRKIENLKQQFRETENRRDLLSNQLIILNYLKQIISVIPYYIKKDLYQSANSKKAKANYTKKKVLI